MNSFKFELGLVILRPIIYDFIYKALNLSIYHVYQKLLGY